MEITLGLAFAAGFISFISPCVLPLVPAYISYMGGRVTNTVAAQAAGGGTITQTSVLTRVSTGLHSLFFVIGFSAVFVGIGLLSTAFVRVVGGGNINTATTIIGRAGGIIIIAFGLHFMGALNRIFNWFRQRESIINVGFSAAVLVLGGLLIFWAFDIPPSPFAENTNIFNRTLISLPVFTALLMWMLLGGAFTNARAFWLDLFTKLELALYADTRKNMAASGQSGFGGSALMGFVFAAGWTPCIGPIYGAILTLAANGGSVSQAGTMLLAYSFGLGLPFIVTALLLDSAQGALRGLNRHMGTIKLVSGVFLIIIGLMVASGQLQRLSTMGASGTFAYNLEECFTGAVAGHIAWGEFNGCMSGETRVEFGTDGAAAVPATNTVDTEAGATVGTLSEASTTANSNVAADVSVGTNVGNLAPNFSTLTADGEQISLEGLRGQVVLVNFWATWCGPCRIEMPEFQEAYERHKDDGFTILAVNNQERAEQVQDFRDELGLTFPLAMDLQGDIQNQWGVLNYPSTYLVDQDGIIIEKHLGALTADSISEMIAEAVG